jgi:hypothetical protein
LNRLIYVSCGFDALERDSRTLLESKKWTIKSADTFTLFPGSDHVETVVVFDRQERNSLLLEDQEAKEGGFVEEDKRGRGGKLKGEKAGEKTPKDYREKGSVDKKRRITRE